MNQNNDDQHLHLLSIFHYIVSGLTALISCFPLIHFTVGIVIIIASLTQSQHSNGVPPFWFGLIFAIAGGSIVLLGWAFSICIALTGRFLAQRKHYMFCMVMAGIQCAFTPFGTVLGIFTIIVLVRQSVKDLFAATTA